MSDKLKIEEKYENNYKLWPLDHLQALHSIDIIRPSLGWQESM